MPNRRPFTMNELKSHESMWKPYLKRPLEEIEKGVSEGKELVLVESTIDDPGQDYSMLELGGERVAYWPGY